MKILSNKRLFFAGILLFGLLAMTARTATDPDVWWHLRTGQWIVETGHVPHSDPFSFTRGGSPWVSHEWLSEVLFFELWKHAGPGLLIVFSSIITTAGFLLLYWRCPGKPHWAAAATVVGALAAAPCWGTRPQMFTFFFASLLLWVIERAEAQPRLLLLIPPVFLLWVNLHAGFALGPVLLLLYATGFMLEAAAGTTPLRQAYRTSLRLLAVVAVCVLVIPLNPSGTQLYRYPFTTLRSPAMRSFIVEWFSPDFHHWLYAPVLLVILLLLTALATSRYRVKGRILLPLIFTTFATLDAVRHIPIFVLLAMPVIAGAIWDRSVTEFHRGESASRFRLVFRATALALLAGFALFRYANVIQSQQLQEAERFPEKAVAMLQAASEPGRVFVYYDWGGYAIWRLYPQYRVFVDGRADLYDDGILQQFQTVVQLGKGWKDTLEDWNIRTVLVPPNSALAQALLLDPQWSDSYRDNHAIVLVRSRWGHEIGEIRYSLASGSALK